MKKRAIKRINAGVVVDNVMEFTIIKDKGGEKWEI